MKKCGGCRKENPESNFSKNRKKPDGLQRCCKSCNKKQALKYYYTNKSDFMRRGKEYKKKFKAEIDNYKAKLGCTKCQENDPCCLDFHHTKNKEKSVAYMLTHASKEKIYEEIKKCIILCSNCHRKLHAGRFLTHNSETSDCCSVSS